MIYFRLFVSFLQVGLFSIGGGYAAMPLIKNQVVEIHRWITTNEFLDLITIAEMTPGPIAINSASFVGLRIAGVLGTLVATFAVILPSCFIVSFLYYLYKKYHKANIMQVILSCLRPAVIALIASAVIMLLKNVLFTSSLISLANIDWIGSLLFAIAFFVLRKFKINPMLVMVASGLAGLVLYSL